jgi:tetratricopeptide (TPR) repeat protein
MSNSLDRTLISSHAALGHEAVHAALLEPGVKVAQRYEIEALLGEGGMGAVYRARDLELDEVIALKTLRAEISSDPAAIERFRREVKLARKVTHPNVARTFDLGSCEGFRFITMELIEGGSLARRVEAGAMSLSDALRVCGDIARGLLAAHSAGVIHRDLKPDNVLLAGASADGPLTGQERVVITDFGIARAAEEQAGSDERATAHRGAALTVGGLIGTPAYMAPEQLMGETPDGRTDVYALGVVLFELLTARPPFDGDSPVAIAMARLKQPPPDVRELLPDLPEAAADLLRSMLAIDRRERPDAAQVLDTIEKLRGVGSSGEAPNMLSGLGLARAPGMTTMLLDATSAPKLRAVAVLSLGSADPALGSLAYQLAATLADALARVRAIKVVPPALAGEDLAALTRQGRVDLALTGTVRAEGERLRVNLRYLDLSLGTQRWSERFEGTLAAPFALEDTLTRAAEAALRGLAGRGDAATANGPSDPAARALYDRALEMSHRINDQEALGSGVEMARRAHALAPTDAWVMSLLGLLLVRLALARRGTDPRSQVAEAEDWALRALNADAGSAATFDTLGLVRIHQGDLRGGVRAFKEALTRDPRDAEASAYLGRFLVESGHLDEGIKRLEFALRIEPNVQHAWWNLARSYALSQQWDRSQQVLEQAIAATGSEATANLIRARVAVWKGDRVFAGFTADRIDIVTPPDHFTRALIEPLRAFARGERVKQTLDELLVTAGSMSAASLKVFWLQVGIELYAASGLIEAALDVLERLPGQPFVDVGWMDHCPALAKIRGAGRFGQVRAVIAARAANLWK